MTDHYETKFVIYEDEIWEVTGGGGNDGKGLEWLTLAETEAAIQARVDEADNRFHSGGHVYAIGRGRQQIRSVDVEVIQMS